MRRRILVVDARPDSAPLYLEGGARMPGIETNDFEPEIADSCTIHGVIDLKFMLARDAFMDFTCTFDAVLQFRVQRRQKLRDGEDSSPL
jgi:hypothetical protein